MTCYAWRRGGEEERLCAHLFETYKVAAQTWELEALSRKVSKLMGLDAESCREAVLIAALLHDVGKAAVTYQEECARGACESFPGHYLVSTLYTYIAIKEGLGVKAPNNPESLAKILSEREKVSNDVISALLILLPIALHHYHQILSYKSLRYSCDVPRARELHKVHSSCIPCLEELAGFIEKNFSRFGGLKKIRELPQLISDERILIPAHIFVQNLGEAVERSKPSVIIFTIEAAAGIVNLSDGTVAARARR
ncbi:MAG: CRISPR-associated endonuclease Cas3'' [Thermofilum sp.]|jgi:CRISPR-associated endonuclease Cas3-HD|nr:CRISPR-associated endonuclease Cas3'' [Thermofilum sp.]